MHALNKIRVVTEHGAPPPGSRAPVIPVMTPEAAAPYRACKPRPFTRE